jgi:hypothetical protein
MSVFQKTWGWMICREAHWYCRIFGHKLCFEDGRRATEQERVDTYYTEDFICSTCKRSRQDIEL